MNESWKDCPLCGSAAQVDEEAELGTCSNVKCPLLVADVWFTADDWNTRAIEDALTERLGAMESRAQAAEQELERLREEGRWIPVSERLPDDVREVVVFEDGMMAFSRCDDGRWYYGDDPSHWLDIPPAPEASDDPA